VMFAVLFAWMLLGQRPHPLQLVGGLLVLAGIVLVRLDQRPQPEAVPAPQHSMAAGR
jgi:drug/metabolite transporter (DMT)-like permease